MRFKRKRRMKGGTFKRRKARRVARVSSVRRMISRAGPPRKTNYITVAPGAVTSSTPQMFNLTGISQGVTQYTRLGQRVMISRFSVRIPVEANPLAASQLRLVLVRDKESLGTLPSSPGEIMLDTTAANWWYSGLNQATVPSRYQILADRLVACNVGYGGAAAAGTPWRKLIKLRAKKKMLQTFNILNTGTIADIEMGSILLFAFTDVAANGPTISAESFFYFHDH